MSKSTTKQETIQGILSSTKDFLTPSEIAPILGVNPHTLRVTARQCPELIGFPFTFSGNRMKIPRVPFLCFVGVNSQSPLNAPEERYSGGDHSPTTNKQELFKQLDNIEKRMQELNRDFQAVIDSLKALSGVIAEK